MAAAGTTTSAISTRSKERIWLIGDPTESIIGSKLPSKHQVLSLFFHHHRTVKKTVRESAKLVTKEVLAFWEKARLSTTQERNIIPKVEKLFTSWKNLQKRAKVRNETQTQKETAFLESLSSLFDIAHADALNLISIEEDKAFLIAQRDGLRGCMSGVDRQLVQKEERSRKRIERAAKRKYKEEERKVQYENLVQLQSSSEEELQPSDKPDDIYGQRSSPAQSQHAKKHQRALNIITPELASALDRTKVSDRDAAYLLAATAHSLGHDVSTVAVNRTSIRTARRAQRRKLSSTVKLDFQVSPNVPLVIHWDGKFLPNITGKGGKVDRLSIIVSSDGKDKLLDVTKLSRGTGEETASALFNAVIEWKLQDRIRAMSYDTTASNTGAQKGACKLFQEKLGRELVYLPCRHHILEIVIGEVFDKCLGPSAGPNISLFKRFRENWDNIDTLKFESSVHDKDTSEIMSKWNNATQEVLNFATNALTELQPRDDYKELLELVIIFLGGRPVRGVRFIAPGAYHRARWMAKIIYSLKIWMFRCQFHLTCNEARGLRDVNIFTAIVYTRAWFTAPLAVSAPSNDLQLLKKLDSYSVINKAISDVATKKFLRHLCYLTEYNVGLSFFADEIDVPLAAKRKMVRALSNKSHGVSQKQHPLLLTNIQGRSLEDSVTEKTLTFFTLLGISHAFLQKNPEDWTTDEDYIRNRELLKKMRVVNDVAERGVALIQEYNEILTKDEEQKQFLLQIVEDHRKRFPNSTKAMLLKGLGQQK